MAVFLLASVRCAATAISENILRYADSSGRPSMLPVCLAKPLCSSEQEEWWSAAYRFCTNTIKDDFSRLRRVLVRGLETVRLVGSHGVSVQMMCHIARSLDAKAKSYRSGQHGCRCSAYDLNQLENRAAFYWEKAKQALQRAQRNQHVPMPKRRLFKEAGDADPSPAMLKPCLEEAVFALSVHAMRTDRLEEAIKGFEKLNNPWAKFYSAKIFKAWSDEEAAKDGDSEDSIIKRRALASRARDCLYDTIDRLEGDRSHELNVSIYKELDELDVMLNDLELEKFKYLGTIISNDGKTNREISARTAQAKINFQKMKTILTNKHISIETRKRALQCYIEPVLMYGCEAWMSRYTRNKM
ncbi:ranbp2-like and grip domain-containing protein 3 [Plakobranchus ocellatus]|uniref:Ranbp2-like and grip domain-containing protein 3 n=1 Tax=Plakobranchus ocellatus TaxID=259542 RepID=A0AAV3ZNE8_9GAST|nr:ranbp2-like and grip domain-containing protein 3 [Plakobranchus ocellatus]